MTAEQFRQMMREELEQLIALSETKGRDYAGEDDALRHLKENAERYGIAPEQVWAVFAGKHWDAVLSAVRHAGDDGYAPSEPVEGRVRDLVVYLFLFLALDREEIGSEDAEEEVYIRRRNGDYWTALGSPDTFTSDPHMAWRGGRKKAEEEIERIPVTDVHIVPAAEAAT